MFRVRPLSSGRIVPAREALAELRGHERGCGAAGGRSPGRSGSLPPALAGVRCQGRQSSRGLRAGWPAPLSSEAISLQPSDRDLRVSLLVSGGRPALPAPLSGQEEPPL